MSNAPAEVVDGGFEEHFTELQQPATRTHGCAERALVDANTSRSTQHTNHIARRPNRSASTVQTAKKMAGTDPWLRALNILSTYLRL